MGMFKKITTTGIVFAFLLTGLSPMPQARADIVLDLPVPGAMISLSRAYVPVTLRGLRVHPDNPLLFDFILDSGDSGLDVHGLRFRSEVQKQIKYFLASLTIKEDDLWVNLSPFEKDRVITQELEKTELGRDMLAQDYILKQLTASLVYPESQLGRQFWDTVYAKARLKYGTSDIPINTFNKVWIVADKAKILERNNTGYVVDAHLKVMLEQDYLSLEKHRAMTALPPAAGNDAASVGSNIVREVVLPEIEKEVNEGKNFAPLRQIFYSMILSTWYRQALKNALLNQVYSNKEKTGGVLSDDPGAREKIFQRYLKAYKKGVFNYIKEDMDPVSRQMMPKRYFSGGEAPDLGVNKVLEVERQAAEGDAAMLAGTGRPLVDVAVVTRALFDFDTMSGDEVLEQIKVLYSSPEGSSDREAFNHLAVFNDGMANEDKAILKAHGLMLENGKIPDIVKEEVGKLVNALARYKAAIEAESPKGHTVTAKEVLDQMWALYGRSEGSREKGAFNHLALYMQGMVKNISDDDQALLKRHGLMSENGKIPDLVSAEMNKYIRAQAQRRKARSFDFSNGNGTLKIEDVVKQIKILYDTPEGSREREAFNYLVLFNGGIVNLIWPDQKELLKGYGLIDKEGLIPVIVSEELGKFVEAQSQRRTPGAVETSKARAALTAEEVSEQMGALYMHSEGSSEKGAFNHLILYMEGMAGGIAADDQAILKGYGLMLENGSIPDIVREDVEKFISAQARRRKARSFDFSSGQDAVKAEDVLKRIKILYDTPEGSREREAFNYLVLFNGGIVNLIWPDQRELLKSYGLIDKEGLILRIASEELDKFVKGQEPSQQRLPKSDISLPNNGGIDLSAKNMALDVNGPGIVMNFNPVMMTRFRKGDFTGVEGVIIKITPVTSPLSALGMEAPTPTLN
jgi:hypothetical protein